MVSASDSFVENSFTWPEAQSADPTCTACAAVVREELVRTHYEWHEALRYIVNTLVENARLVNTLDSSVL